MSARDQLAPAEYEEVLGEHRRLVRELDVLLNGASGAAKQASLVDLIAQVRREGVIVLSETDERCLALGRAINRAAAELPIGYELNVEAELGAGTVALYDTDCDRIEEFSGDTLAAQVENAIEYARTRADELGDADDELPDGLSREADGTLTYRCRKCDAKTEWPAEVADFDINNPANVCGGSLHCLP